MNTYEIFGYLAMLSTLATMFFQYKKAFKNRSAKDISSISQQINLAKGISWLEYSKSINAIPNIIVGIIGILYTIWLLIFKVKTEYINHNIPVKKDIYKSIGLISLLVLILSIPNPYILGYGAMAYSLIGLFVQWKKAITTRSVGDISSISQVIGLFTTIGWLIYAIGIGAIPNMIVSLISCGYIIWLLSFKYKTGTLFA